MNLGISSPQRNGDFTGGILSTMRTGMSIRFPSPKDAPIPQEYMVNGWRWGRTPNPNRTHVKCAPKLKCNMLHFPYVLLKNNRLPSQIKFDFTYKYQKSQFLHRILGEIPILVGFVTGQKTSVETNWVCFKVNYASK